MPKIAFDPQYVRVCGNVVSALVLSQIEYWFAPSKAGKSKLSIKRDGKLWVAKSREELRMECGLTEWQLRSAMSHLKKLGLVESEIHLFQNKTTPHLHLNTERMAQLMKVDPPIRLGGNLRTGQEGSISTGWEETSQPLSIDYSKEYSKDYDLAHSAKAKIGFVATKVVEEKKMATVKEILANKKALKNPKSVKVGVALLSILWKKRMGQEYGGFVKELTGQERGQMKLILDKVGPDAAKVVDWCLTHWGQFCFEAKAAYGLHLAPDKPVIGFVLKYHDVAVKYAAKVGLQSVAKVATVVDVPVPVPVPVQIEAVTKFEPVSKAHVLEALEKLKGMKGG